MCALQVAFGKLLEATIFMFKYIRETKFKILKVKRYILSIVFTLYVCLFACSHSTDYLT